MAAATFPRAPVAYRPAQLSRLSAAGADDDLGSVSVATERLRPKALSHVLLLAVVACFASFLAWAAWASLDEVTHGDGRVIPSRQLQVVQNLEGGIVAALLAREGEVVEEGQVLLRIDNVRAATEFREKKARHTALLASAARLEAELGRQTDVTFPPEVLAAAPQSARNELALFRSRKENLASETDILERQAEQRGQELRELRSKLGRLDRSAKLAQEELSLAEGVAMGGAMARGDFLRVRRQANDLKGELDQTRLAVPRAETALAEANKRVENATTAFRADAQGKLNEVATELAELTEVMTAGEDRVRRTEVRSPVRGTIKQLKVATVGGVVQPGADLVEIVPLEDTLLVEAQIRPSDIAFISPGQAANVKITAYDYAIYGGLEGTVEDISADTIENERHESFYRVRVRTERNRLGTGAKPLAIIPGMTAQVDVLTGRKTVLDYLLKPILRARDNALRER